MQWLRANFGLSFGTKRQFCACWQKLRHVDVKRLVHRRLEYSSTIVRYVILRVWPCADDWRGYFSRARAPKIDTLIIENHSWYFLSLDSSIHSSIQHWTVLCRVFVRSYVLYINSSVFCECCWANRETVLVHLQQLLRNCATVHQMYVNVLFKYTNSSQLTYNTNYVKCNATNVATGADPNNITCKPWISSSWLASWLAS